MVAARDPSASVPMGQTGRLSVKDIALQIRSEKGLKGFWSGYSASLILTMNPALTFLLQNLIKRILARSRRESPGPKTLFLIAAISKAIASTLTYPFSLAKSRAQVSTSPTKVAFAEKELSASSPPRYPEKPDLDSPNPIYKATRFAKKATRVLLIERVAKLAVIRSLRDIYRTEGVSGLYSGLEADVVKGFLGHGLSMALKERIHVFIISAYYLVLKLTRRWPEDLGSIRDQASQEFQRVRTTAGALAEDASKKAGDIAEDASKRVMNVTETVAEGVKSVVSNNDD